MSQPREPIVYTRFKGKFNKTPIPTPLQPGSGYANLDVAENVIVDDEYRVRTRYGRTIHASGNYHSFFSADTFGLVVKNNNLMRVSFNPFTELFLRADLGEHSVSYASNGMDRIYYTNGTVIEYVFNNDIYELADPGIAYHRPLPPGEFLEFYNGRLYLGRDGLLIYSRVNADFYDYREDESMINIGGNLTMVAPTSNGLYVANETETLFLSGLDPSEMTVKDISKVGAIKGSASKHRNVTITFKGSIVHFDNAVMWSSIEGVMLGGEDGKVVNLTEALYLMPSASKGVGLIVKNISGLPDHYIMAIQ